MKSERRRFPRAPLAVLLEIWAKDKKKTIGKGFITNLSEGGLAIETNFRLNLGDNFLLRFTLPNGWNFDLWGDIVYINEGVLTKAYGVKFNRIETEQKSRIKRFILANLELK